MACHSTGMSKFMLTKIPHFKEVIVSAFECPSCGYKNNYVQSAGPLAPKGCIQTCSIQTKADLNRQVVKADAASIQIPELEFEMPPSVGVLTTVEGLLRHVIQDLSDGQDQRKAENADVFLAVQNVINHLEDYVEGKSPFSVVMNDPTGNSYIESLTAPSIDPQIAITHYVRTKEQLEALGYASESVEESQEQAVPIAEESQEIPDEFKVYTFPSNCSTCRVPCDTRMHVIDIPYFKEVIIMSTSCDSCGYKSNEVKSGTEIPPLGKRITLKITSVADLSRDILKSETCGLSVPEIELELTQGSLGGRFTTVEGILTQVRNQLSEKLPFVSGDSATVQGKSRMAILLSQLDEICAGTKPVTLILDDPLASSYLQNLYAPDEDPQMTIEEYERTYDQNEDLGLNDMIVEDYGEKEILAQEQSEKEMKIQE